MARIAKNISRRIGNAEASKPRSGIGGICCRSGKTISGQFSSCGSHSAGLVPRERSWRTFRNSQESGQQMLTTSSLTVAIGICLLILATISRCATLATAGKRLEKWRKMQASNGCSLRLPGCAGVCAPACSHTERSSTAPRPWKVFEGLVPDRRPYQSWEKVPDHEKRKGVPYANPS